MHLKCSKKVHLDHSSQIVVVVVTVVKFPPYSGPELPRDIAAVIEPALLLASLLNSLVVAQQDSCSTRAWVAVEEGDAEFGGWDCWRLGVCWDGIADQRVEGGHERVAEDRACGASRHVEGGWCRLWNGPVLRI